MNFITGIANEIGGLLDTFYKSIISVKEIKRTGRSFIQQIAIVGSASLPLVAITSAFIGMVASIQTAYQIRDYVPMIYLGSGVAKAVMIELGPVITGLVVAGRVGAGMAAEIGTMKVTEQIGALEVMGIDPYRFLVLPRILAGIVALPLLVVFSDFIAIFSGMGAAHFMGIANYEIFARGAKLFFIPKDLFGGLFKASVFGGLLTLCGCFYGLETKGGAQGVGNSTTRAVVSASLLILGFDYLLGTLIFG